MNVWVIIIGTVYFGVLVYVGLSSFRKTKSAEDYILGGSKLGTIIGMMTFAATLFSTFTLMGMPDFFRLHGVGAWIFLAISDAAMFFLILWFGFHLRRRASKENYKGVGGLMNSCFGTPWAGRVYFLGVFLFLIPYVAIQIRGIAIFLNAVFPEALPPWGWSLGIVGIMLMYSELGGLKAIIYNDVIQGTILLVVLWIIAAGCLNHFGGIANMFDQVKQVDESLLSTPGPNGLFTFQFLFSSFFAIILIPVTQPQVTTRLVIMRSKKTLHSMAVSLGIFTFLILTPTIFIGLYGAVLYGDTDTETFLANVLLFEQIDFIAALVVIGLLAAATSTADSQIFALGSELRSLLKGDEKKIMRITRIAIFSFGFAALIFSIFSTNELVLLARLSFAGTSIMAPMILTGLFAKGKPSPIIIWSTAAGILIFLASLLKLVPEMIGFMRIDLLLLIVLTVIAIIAAKMQVKTH